jgi:hypothetical protein
MSHSAEKIEDPEERFLRVLQYYLAGWHIELWVGCLGLWIERFDVR